jgi:uncharacterized coiled-coil DUF342 family protein
MTDRAFHEIADRIAEWVARDEYIEELIAENHQQHTDLGSIARERDALREECADLHATNEALRARLTRALDGERRAQRRLRKRDVRGWVALAWWKLTGGM